MRNFIINSKSGIEFEVGINETPVVGENFLGEYKKSLTIESLKVDGTEVPKNTAGRLFLVELGHARHEGENKLVVKITYDAAKFIKKLKKITSKQETLYVPCSPELVDYYNHTFLPAADRLIEEIKTKKAQAVQAAFDGLTDETVLQIEHHTSYGYSIIEEYGKHKWFKEGFQSLKKANIHIQDAFAVNVDMGDYSLSTTYKIPFGELKKLFESVRAILGPQEKKDTEEKAAREKRRTALKCEILKEGKEHGGEGLDLYALVRMTDPQTQETLEFNCRNIFDFGYVVNPNYAVDQGCEKGGIVDNGKWQAPNKKDVRELTGFEKRCIQYLYEFPLIRSDIRI